MKHTAHTFTILILLATAVLPQTSEVNAANPLTVTGLPLKTARVCVTGFDHNRPDPFPGLGDFIGWVGDVTRLANGELLFVHSAGYWHVSFATPIILNENLIESYKSLNEATVHGGFPSRLKVRLNWVEAEALEEDDGWSLLEHAHGILVPGGFGLRGTRGMMKAAEYARAHGVPFFGICYGFQVMAQQLGGEVAKTGAREYGSTEVRLAGDGGVFLNEQPPTQSAWMSHGDSVVKAPEGFEVLASSDSTPVAAFGSDERKLYGVQWHPEVKHSAFGQQVLENFLHRAAGIAPEWNADNVIAEQVARIQAQVGSIHGLGFRHSVLFE